MLQIAAWAVDSVNVSGGRHLNPKVRFGGSIGTKSGRDITEKTQAYQ